VLLAIWLGLIACTALSGVEPSADAQLVFFDRVVTPEAVFPGSAQRGLYRMLPPVTERGRRSYTFELDALPGLNVARHFDVITITWTRGGALPAGTVSVLPGTGGPNGSFVDAVARTEDGVFEVRVSHGRLLPRSVDVPDFDVVGTAERLSLRYKQRQGEG